MADEKYVPSAEELATIRYDRVINELAEIRETLARFDTAINGFLGSIAAASQSGGMAGMLARAVLPTDARAMQPRL